MLLSVKETHANHTDDSQQRHTCRAAQKVCIGDGDWYVCIDY